MGNLKSLNQQVKSLKEIATSIGKKEVVDPCPICDAELYFDGSITKRCGLLDAGENVVGWLCPSCRSEFDDNDELVDIFTNIKIKGDT